MASTALQDPDQRIACICAVSHMGWLHGQTAVSVERTNEPPEKLVIEILPDSGRDQCIESQSQGPDRHGSDTQVCTDII